MRRSPGPAQANRPLPGSRPLLRRRPVKARPSRRIRPRESVIPSPGTDWSTPASRRPPSLRRPEPRQLLRPKSGRHLLRAATVRKSLWLRHRRAAIRPPDRRQAARRFRVTPRWEVLGVARGGWMSRLVQLRRTPGSSIPCHARPHRHDRALRQRTAAPWQGSSTRLVARRGKDGSQTLSRTTVQRLASGRTTTWYGEKWATCCGRCGAGRRRRMPLKGRPLCSSEPASFAPRASWCPRWGASIRMRRTGCSDSCGPPPSVSPDRPFGPPAAIGPRTLSVSAATPGLHVPPLRRSARASPATSPSRPRLGFSIEPGRPPRRDFDAASRHAAPTARAQGEVTHAAPTDAPPEPSQPARFGFA